MRASVVMRSTEVGKCAARPWEDLAPLIAWSAEIGLIFVLFAGEVDPRN